jgi:DNA sulfur modification protein DndC
MTIDHIATFGKEKVLGEIYTLIQNVYLNDNRPWVIGYSGGKDSTLTTMLVFEAISRLPINQRTKEIHILSTNTMVENPLIINYIKRNMDLMNSYSREKHLNVKATILQPELKETFWTLLIGKGYPSPRQKFRWCTHRLKIKPMDEYTNQLAKETGSSVIVLLGVRSAESNTRRKSIENHSVEGKILKKHTTNPNAFVFAPIETLSNDDVWSCLLNSVSPWGFDNNLLLSLYRDASDESECPIQQDTNAPSCGQSRFGCWICTVVSKDKSLSGFIQNEYDELRPLLRFRNYLTEIREDHEYRQDYRMDGTIYFVGADKERRGLGPFSLNGRKLILRELLKTEKAFNKYLQNAEKQKFTLDQNVYYPLVTNEELELIRNLWIEEGDWEDSLPLIYNEVMGKELYEGYTNQPFISSEDQKLLEEICIENKISSDIIKSLITLENKFLGMKQRPGIYKSIDKILNKDIVHEALFELHRGEQNAIKEN